MNDEIKKCIDARVNMFDQYFTIPEDMKSDVALFIEDINALGNKCSDATVFEEKFVSEGLSDRFNEILPKCTPKKVKMTKEQKINSVIVAKNIAKDNKKEIIKDTVNDVKSSIYNDIKDDAIDKNRKRMIENDTFDDYSRVTSATGGKGIWSALDFIKNKFKK